MARSVSRKGRMIDTYVAKVPPAPENTRPSKSGGCERKSDGRTANPPKTEKAAG